MVLVFPGFLLKFPASCLTFSLRRYGPAEPALPHSHGLGWMAPRSRKLVLSFHSFCHTALFLFCFLRADSPPVFLCFGIHFNIYFSFVHFYNCDLPGLVQPLQYPPINKSDLTRLFSNLSFGLNVVSLDITGD